MRSSRIVVAGNRIVVAGIVAIAAVMALAILGAAPALAASCTDSWLNPASGSWTTGGNWSTGAVPTASDDVCITVGASDTYAVTLNASVSVRSLTLGDSSGSGVQTLNVQSAPGVNAGLGIAANSIVEPTGNLELDTQPSSGDSVLSGPATATLTDDGYLLVAHDGTNTDYLQANLDVGAGGAVEVGGTLSQNDNTSTINDGTFTVDSTGVVGLSTSGDVFDNEGTLSNQGSLSLTGDASFDQSAGSAPQSGNPVEIFGSGLLTDTSGGGNFDLVDSAELSGTIPAGQTVTAEAFSGHNADVTLAGSPVTNNGAFVLDEPAGGGVAELVGGSDTFVNNGTFTSQSEQTTPGDAYLQANFTNGANGTVHVTNGTLVQNDNTTDVNDGLVRIDSGAGLNLGTSGDVFDNHGAITNNGVFSLTGDASFTQNAGSATQTDNNPIEIFSSGLLTDDTGGGSFDLVDSAGLTGTIPATQTVTAEAFPGHNAGVTLQGSTVTNDGTFVLDSPVGGGIAELVGPSTTTFVNNGAFVSQSEKSPAATNILQANLTNGTAGTVTLFDGALSANDNTTTVNHGVIEVTPGAELNFTTSGDVLTNDSDGTLQPDLASATSFGTINLTGGAGLNVGGTLFPNLIGNFAPPPGATFKVITGSSGGGQTFTVTNGFTGLYSPSTTPPSISVARSKDGTTTSLQAAPKPSTFGQPVTLTATITAGPGGVGNPTGTVTFSDGPTVLGTGSVSTSAGVSTATFQTTVSAPLPVGPNELTASYGGDGNYVGSATGSAIDDVVGQATPGVSVGTSSSSPTYNSPVTFTATITGPGGVPTPPTGGVTFFDGSTQIGTGGVSTTAGVTTASFTTSALTGGNHQITAQYNGDANYSSASSTSPATLDVAQLASTTSLTASPNPAAFNQQVTLTATVAPSVGANPTGTVTFTADGGAQTLGTGTLSSAAGTTTASLTVGLTPGTYSVIASYAGDQNFASSASSPAVSVVVNPQGPTITQQPTDQTVTAPAAATFTAAASGSTGVQWQVSTNGGASWSNDTSDAGNATTTLTVSPTSATQSGNEYRAQFSNAGGSTPTNAATLTVNAPPCAAGPTITTSPSAQSVVAPNPAQFTAAASDPANCHKLTVQWQVSTNLGITWSSDTTDGGNTTDTLTISPTATSLSGHRYRAVFTDEHGSTNSAASTLTVTAACTARPAITTEPQNQTVDAPGAATFTAAVSIQPGCATPSVQWQVSTRYYVALIGFNGPFTDISGANSPTLTISPTALSQSGYEYRALFTNPVGTTTSAAARLVADVLPNVGAIYPRTGTSVCCVAIAGGGNYNPVATTQVLFGSTPASFEVLTAGLIAAVPPPEPAGTIVGITVYNGGLASPANPSDVFEYTGGTGGPAVSSAALGVSSPLIASADRAVSVRLTRAGRRLFTHLMHGKTAPRVLTLRRGRSVRASRRPGRGR